MRYNAGMTNPYDPNTEDDTNDSDLLMPYDDTFNEEEFVAELMEEGYSEEEARRMAGDYDADEFYGFDDNGDRDVPDFVDGGDFE
jgi:hypothetical protein